MRIFIFILCAAQASAMTLQNQGYGARQVALGQTIAAGAAEGAYGMVYNAAQMSAGQNPEFSMDYAQLLMGLTDRSSLSQSYLGFSYPWQRLGKPPEAAGFAYSAFSLASLYREDVFYGSYSRGFPRRFFDVESFWGATLKRVNRSYGDQPTYRDSLNSFGAHTGQADPVFAGGKSQGGWSLDLSLYGRHPTGVAAGFQLADINEPDLALGAQADKLRRSTRFGLAYQKPWQLAFGADLEMKKRLDSATDRRIHLGAERWIPSASFGSFAFRGGFGFGSRSWKNFYAGVGWKSNALGIDYGFQMPLAVESISGSHRFTLTLRFGEPPAEEAISELYRNERKARVRAQEDLEGALDDLERLLRASEERERREKETAVAVIPMRAETQEEKAAARAKAANVPPAAFWDAWKLYKQRVENGAGRRERLEIVRRMIDIYGSWEPARGEWSSLQAELDADRREFALIWKNYQSLASMGAERVSLVQMLQRITRRFEASGIELNAVYREIDRLR